jgi:hypothetical protein
MRRFLLVPTALVLMLAMIAPAWADVTLKESVPRRDRAKLEKVCDDDGAPIDITASDRLEQRATSTFSDDMRDLLSRTISGKQLTVFQWGTDGPTTPIETVGTTSITRNDDGTYTLVQKGSGFWFDDGSFSEIDELVRFTGTVTAVGNYDAKSFTFQPISRTFSGITAPMCPMLEVGLKTRH